MPKKKKASHTTRNTPSNAVTTSEEKWIENVRKEVNSAGPVEGPGDLRTIFRVPYHIRQLDDKVYDPVVASIGPFHHADLHSTDSEKKKPQNNKPPYWRLVEDYKRRCVQHLLSRHGSQLLDKCLLELKKQDRKVRSCYSEKLPARLGAQKLAEIMLFDGYFIICLMLIQQRNESSSSEGKMQKGTGEARKKEKKTTCWEVVLNIRNEVLGKLEHKTSDKDEDKKRREGMTDMGEGEVDSNIREKKGEVVLDVGEEEQLEDPTVAGLFTFDLVLYDLLKLENQIPFFIIQLLFDQLKPCEHDLVDLALKLFKDIYPKESESFKEKKEKSPSEYHHLLHLFYLSRIPAEKSEEKEATSECKKSEEKKEEATTSQGTPTSASGCILGAIECMKSKRKKKVEAASSQGSMQGNWESAPRWTPNATELDRAGVKFKRKEHEVDCFLDITFERRKMKITPLLCLLKLRLMFRSGQMEIPPLQIDEDTGPLFQNLIAFEQCYPNTEMYITIYGIFMNCIIDQAEDVQLLHLEGILEHGLGNDQAVADLFNKLGSQTHCVWETNYLKSQINKINKFYDSKWHKLLAGLRRNYLSSPWAIISVLAAIFLLLLSVEQAVFSALSYFHSP